MGKVCPIFVKVGSKLLKHDSFFVQTLLSVSLLPRPPTRPSIFVQRTHLFPYSLDHHLYQMMGRTPQSWSPLAMRASLRLEKILNRGTFWKVSKWNLHLNEGRLSYCPYFVLQCYQMSRPAICLWRELNMVRSSRKSRLYFRRCLPTLVGSVWGIPSPKSFQNTCRRHQGRCPPPLLPSDLGIQFFVGVGDQRCQ